METVRDRNLICTACDGDLLVIGKSPGGGKIYNCSRCGDNILYECISCHLPKNVDASGQCLRCRVNSLVEKSKRSGVIGGRCVVTKGEDVDVCVGNKMVNCKKCQIVACIAEGNRLKMILEIVPPRDRVLDLVRKPFELTFFDVKFWGILTDYNSAIMGISGEIMARPRKVN